ncbi:MAG: LL-diaminopimelate aminotransferase [Firmicutes bacterium]|nr:LL-diaminopimelate aminotransferase [Bacillota bacterium]
MINRKLLEIDKENSFNRSSKLIKEYRASHPDSDIISLGIGDVSFPVPGPVAEAMKKACGDLSFMDTFQGYGAYWGIESLRKAISVNDYRGLGISAEEIYVGDGTKSDCTSILELFDPDARILVSDPCYPVYRNGAMALGRDVSVRKCGPSFKLEVPKEHFDVIYICSPCNPVGNAYTGEELSSWIEYANRNGAYIVYDNVYKDFRESSDVPGSIYELEGSRTCCIEMRSYSKSASFSGTRCSYFVLPKEFGEEIHSLWRERTINRFNGASYVAQKGAEATYLPESQEIIRSHIEVYKGNAALLKECFSSAGFSVTGGTDAPYFWVNTPSGMDSWEAFGFFLNEMEIVIVPGSIFGSEGKRYMRISALGSREDCIRACGRIKKYCQQPTA